MADYSRATERFFFAGISCFPPDVLPVSKYPYVRNMRSYAEGELRPRDGLTVTQSVAGEVHTLARLNDPTTFNGGVPAVRLIGAGTDLYRGTPGNAAPGIVDAGYSGDPLSILSAQPPQSPRPWAYIADSDQFRKFTTDGDPYAVGLAQPGPMVTVPTVAVDKQLRNAFDLMTSVGWNAAGTVASTPTTFNRINTTISQILYDDGATGYCSIVPADPANITVGTLLTIGPPLGIYDNEIVTDVTIAVAATTVAAIIYDSGTTGLCTVQPAGSLGTGQLDAPPVAAYRRRAFRQQQQTVSVPDNEADLPPAPDPTQPTRRIRQVDFPVNAVINLGGEIVRILSVAVGQDGVQSFRCSTSATIAAGASITGLAAFRIFLPNTWAPGDGILRIGQENTLTYVAPEEGERAKMTGGIQTVFAENLAQFANGRAVQPDDELHLAVKINRLTEIVSVRVYIDVDQTTNDFLQNYFFHEWRASDIIASIQATNAINVAPLVESRKTVVANRQLEFPPRLTLGRGPDPWWTRNRPERQRQVERVRERNQQGQGQARARQATSESAIATQLALGNNQWIDLRVKISTLTRVGTDPTRTLANAAAFEVLVACEGPQIDVTPDPITVQYSDLQVYGGGSPDIGDVGDPYVYCYRYRSSQTGGVSNPSPANRGGALARRQNISLVATPSADPQVDRIDWFRIGGTLGQYTYVGTGPNSADPFTDDRMDSAISGGEIVSYDNFQPWALQDLPRTGTCNVAGTAIEWVSGDVFNTAWAPGSVILVNGRATILYASPTSSAILHVTDNVGSGTAVEFTLPGPTLLSQPLARFWGDYQGFYFACGDQTNPGTLYWSNGNNIEATSDANALIVTTPSEPLMNGGIYNTFPFVASSEQIYALGIVPGSAGGAIRAIRTPCGRGFWTPWAFALAPEGIYFLAPDGIALTAGGSPAEMITTPDLRNIFPKDGVPGQTTNGIPAPDMSQTNRLRLSYIAGWLYFDYVDVDGASWTLICDTAVRRFFLDNSDYAGMRLRLEEPGAGVYNQILGADNGEVLQYDTDALTDAGTDISYELDTRWSDVNAPRIVKQWGDMAVNCAGGGNPITFQPVGASGTEFPVATVATPGPDRETVIIGLPASYLADNLGVNISGVVGAARPRFFWWEPSFVPKSDVITRRVTDWEDLGYVGAKFIQGIVIRANTYGLDKTIQIQRDGGAAAIDLTINHDGEEQIAYPLAADGWEPFVTELIRMVGTDDVPWQLLGYRFIWEPAPELATEWHTQYTAIDWAGYGTVHDMVFAYEATSPFILTFTYDDRTQVYVIPPNGGVYSRYYFPFCPNKAKAVKFQWRTATPGRIYKNDVSTRTQGWGVGGGYHVHQPFGGPSRVDGAAI